MIPPQFNYLRFSEKDVSVVKLCAQETWVETFSNWLMFCVSKHLSVDHVYGSLTPVATLFQLYRCGQSTYPCFPRVLLTSTPRNILSNPPLVVRQFGV